MQTIYVLIFLIGPNGGVGQIEYPTIETCRDARDILRTQSFHRQSFCLAKQTLNKETK